MIIIWGKKIVRRRAGVLADFCPFCRVVSKYRAVNVFRVGHLYYIPMGRGDLVVHEITCQTCSLARAFTPGGISPEPDTADDLADVAARTSPRGLDNLHARVEMETRVPSNDLDPEERAALIAEPFAALEYFLEVQRARGADRSISSLISAGAIIFGLVAAILIMICFEPRPDRTLIIWTVIMTLLTLIFIPWAIYRAATDRRRVASSKHILAPLARALRPLNPTLPELQQAITICGHRGSSLAKLDPIALENAINAVM